MNNDLTPALATMANQSLLYLQETDIPINCSVYSVPFGSLQYLDFDNTTGDISGDFLPAYYVTNCLISNLIELVANLNISTSLDITPYNKRDNGDTFIALLFMISGSCVSCWMLTLLLYLSPKHKRKPLLAQLATILYSIVATILLSKITNGAETEYYDDNLDIIQLHDDLYMGFTYRGTIIVSQILTHLAWFQIVWRLTDKFKQLIMALGAVLMAGFTIFTLFYEIKYKDTTSIFNSIMSWDLHQWRIARVVLKMLILIWLAANLLYFTVSSRNPRICYSRRLLPLAIFNWLLFIIHMVINILTLSIFKYRGLVKSWLALLPFLIEIIIITTVWEWIFNITHLEKRSELMGVLGRRINIDDVISLHLNHSNPPTRTTKLAQKFNFSNLLHRVSGKPVEILDTYELKDLSTSTYGSGSEIEGGVHPIIHRTTGIRVDEDEGSEDIDEAPNETEIPQESLPTQQPAQTDAQNHSYDLPREIHESNQLTNNPYPQLNNLNGTSSAGSYDEEYVEYEIWDGNDDIYSDNQNLNDHIIPQNNQLTSQNDQLTSQNDPPPPHNDSPPLNTTHPQNQQSPPPFEPHPGFNSDDYWPTRKS